MKKAYLFIFIFPVSTVLLSACGSPNYPARQVESDNPSVTYIYRGDAELVEANEKAITYCSQYRASPTTSQITNESGGKKRVTFNCVANPPAYPTSPPPINTNYTYRTDQELITAANNAAQYCYNQGGQRAVSTMVNNPDGTRTITFQCVAR